MGTDSGSPNTAIVVGLIALLAGLDFAGALLAKEWTVQHRPWQLAGAAVAFAALFVVFVAGLRYAELTVLTFGWIVGLQTGVVLVDRARYDVAFSRGRWVAVVAIVVLQGYLLLGSSTPKDVSEPTPRGRGQGHVMAIEEQDQPSAARAES